MGYCAIARHGGNRHGDPQHADGPRCRQSRPGVVTVTATGSGNATGSGSSGRRCLPVFAAPPFDGPARDLTVRVVAPSQLEVHCGADSGGACRQCAHSLARRRREVTGPGPLVTWRLRHTVTVTGHRLSRWKASDSKPGRVHLGTHDAQAGQLPLWPQAPTLPGPLRL